MLDMRFILAALYFSTGVLGAPRWAITKKAIAPRASSTSVFAASLCGSPCTISFDALTTTLTLTPPAATVSVSDSLNSVTVNFDVITTETVIKPEAQTFDNNDPSGTTSITLSSLSLDGFHAQATDTYTNTDGQQQQVVVDQEVDMDDFPALLDDDAVSEECPIEHARRDTSPPIGYDLKRSMILCV
jgi:hypothetical protein